MSKAGNTQSPDANPGGKTAKPWWNKRVKPSTMLALFILLLSAGAFIVAGGYLSNSATVDGTVPMNATNGPTVNFTGLSSDDADLTNPFPNDETIEWRSNEGNITVQATTNVTMNISASDINGTWTNVTSIGNNSANVSLRPDDKQDVTVKGADNISFRDMVLDDGTADFEVGGSQANATVTIHEQFSGVNGVVAVDGAGNFIDGNNTDSNGNVTLTIDTSTTVVKLQSSQSQTPSLTNPDPEGAQDGFPTTISIDVEDDDFPNDNVTVEFDMNNTDIGTDYVTSDGTASVSIGGPGLGQHTVNVTATDTFGNVQTFSWTFSTPENLTIRNVTNPDEILDNRRINATFFDDGEIIEKSTTNGNISMEGIPGKENVVVSLEDVSGGSDEYYGVETLVLDFTEQTDAYMLHTNMSERTVRFTLEDQTGGVFENNNASVLVQKPLNRTGWNSPRWELVYSDEFGPKGATATLEDGQRYRVIVRNDRGDQRVLGAYSADADETVSLEVGDVTVVPEGDDKEFAHNISWDDSGSPTYIRFEYNDSEKKTTNIWVKIYEFGNKSNVLVSNTSFGGPHGNFSFSEPVTGDDANTTWAVDVVVERDGESIQIKEPAGPNNPVLTSLSDRMQIIISIGTILVVAGLFSRVNGHWGGLVIAGLGGIFWWIGFLPAGIGIVVLSMVVAGTIFLREREVSGI